MINLKGTINLPSFVMRRSEFTDDIIHEDQEADVVKAKLIIDDEGNALYWAWNSPSNWAGTEKNKPERRTFKIKVDPKIHTDNWTVDHVGESWKSIYWFGKLGYQGSKSKLTEIQLSSCDDFQTVYVTIVCEHKRFNYRGEKPEMAHVQDYGIINVSNPEQLQDLYNSV